MHLLILASGRSLSSRNNVGGGGILHVPLYMTWYKDTSIYGIQIIFAMNEVDFLMEGREPY